MGADFGGGDLERVGAADVGPGVEEPAGDGVLVLVPEQAAEAFDAEAAGGAAGEEAAAFAVLRGVAPEGG